MLFLILLDRNEDVQIAPLFDVPESHTCTLSKLENNLTIEQKVLASCSSIFDAVKVKETTNILTSEEQYLWNMRQHSEVLHDGMNYYKSPKQQNEMRKQKHLSEMTKTS